MTLAWLELSFVTSRSLKPKDLNYLAYVFIVIFCAKISGVCRVLGRMVSGSSQFSLLTKLSHKITLDF